MACTGRSICPARVTIPLLLALTPIIAAAPPRQPPAVDLLPDEADRGVAQGILSRQAGRPVTLSPPEPLLLESLRWAVPQAARAGCDDQALALLGTIAQQQIVAAPASPAGVLGALLEQASVQLQRQDAKGALASIQATYSILPCSTSILTREQVRALFLEEAVAHLYLNDGLHAPRFADVVAVDPRLYIEPQFPQSVKTAFAEAVTGQLNAQMAALSPGTQIGELFVDGQSAATLAEVRPGRHVVQWRALKGEVRTAVATLEPGLAVRLSNVTELGLPSLEQTREALTRGVGSGWLSRSQIAGIERFLAMRGRKELGFAVRPPGESAAKLRFYQIGKGLVGPGGAPVAPSTALVPAEAGTGSSAAGATMDGAGAAAGNADSRGTGAAAPATTPATASRPAAPTRTEGVARAGSSSPSPSRPSAARTESRTTTPATPQSAPVDTRTARSGGELARPEYAIPLSEVVPPPPPGYPPPPPEYRDPPAVLVPAPPGWPAPTAEELAAYEQRFSERGPSGSSTGATSPARATGAPSVGPAADASAGGSSSAQPVRSPEGQAGRSPEGQLQVAPAPGSPASGATQAASTGGAAVQTGGAAAPTAGPASASGSSPTAVPGNAPATPSGRPSRNERGARGNGLAIGVGYLYLLENTGRRYTSTTESGKLDEVVPAFRPPFQGSPVLTLSGTHAGRHGIGIQARARLLPSQPSAVGRLLNAQYLPTYTLLPSYYSGSLALYIGLHGRSSTFQMSVGGMACYFSYVSYLATLETAASTSRIQAALGLPAIGAGPDVTIGFSQVLGGGVQLGLQLEASYTRLSPYPGLVSGTTTYNGASASYTIDPETLWGPHLGASLFIRTPLF